MKVKVLWDDKPDSFQERLQHLINDGWKPLWETFRYQEITWSEMSASSYVIILKKGD